MNATETDRSLAIDVTESMPEKISVVLKGTSSVDQRVSYKLETRGASTSLHKGQTSLSANSPVILSTIKFSASKNWCVTLSVTEEAGRSYQIVKGNDCS